MWSLGQGWQHHIRKVVRIQTLHPHGRPAVSKSVFCQGPQELPVKQKELKNQVGGGC